MRKSGSALPILVMVRASAVMAIASANVVIASAVMAIASANVAIASAIVALAGAVVSCSAAEPQEEQIRDLSPPVMALTVQMEKLLKSGKSDQAQQLTQHYQTGNPCREDYYLALASLYRKYKYNQQANEKLATGLKHFPDSFALHYKTAQYWQSVNELDLAEPELRACLRLSPRSLEAHSLMARLYNDRMDFANALKEIDTALAIRPDQADLLQTRAISLQNLGRTAEAVSALDKAVALSYHVDYNLRKLRAPMLQQLKRFPEAIADYLYMSNVAPKYNEVFFERIGACYLGLNKPKEALNYFDRSLKCQSDFIHAHRGRLAALEALHDTAGAAQERNALHALEGEFTPNK